jgi:hypothetical protein
VGIAFNVKSVIFVHFNQNRNPSTNFSKSLKYAAKKMSWGHAQFNADSRMKRRGVTFCVLFADAPKTYDTVSNGVRPAIAALCSLKTGQAVCLENCLLTCIFFSSRFFVWHWKSHEPHRTIRDVTPGSLSATDTCIVYHVTHFEASQNVILLTHYVSTWVGASCGRGREINNKSYPLWRMLF